MSPFNSNIKVCPRWVGRPCDLFYILMMSLLLLHTQLRPVLAKKNGNPQYSTAYACEGRQLSIACEEGHLINLIRANYGRFSISICNEHGNLDWSVDCTSPRSYFVIDESCGKKRGCSLNASSAVFGDPCPGTLKYLEAHYQCVPESTTTSSTTTPSTTTSTTSTPPPIIIPLTRIYRPSSTSSTTNAPSTTTTTISSTSTTMTSIVIKPATEASVKYNPSNPYLGSTTENPFLGHQSTKIFPYDGTTTGSPPLHRVYLYQTTPWPGDTRGTRYGAHHSNNVIQRVGQCPPVYIRHVQWNWTRAGETAVNKCPGGALGHAKWLCGSNPVQWSTDRPDLSQCTSYWIDNLKRSLDNGDSVVTIASELAELSRSKPFHGGDIALATDMLLNIVSKMTERLQDFTDEIQKHKVVQELLDSVLRVSSNMLDDFQQQAWLDLPKTRQRLVASTLLEGMERSSWMVASSQNNRYHFSRALAHVLVSVRLLEAWAVAEVSFPIPEDTQGTSWREMEDSLVLPAQAAHSSSSDGVVKVVFMAFNKVQDFLGYFGHLDNGPYVAKRNGEAPESENTTNIINSRVLSATVNGYHVLRLLEPVIVTFKHILMENVSNPQCVYWNIQARSWSGNGCWIRGFNVTHTTCACNHLTNFALVMELSASQVKNPMLLTLHLVTTVGCAIAIFFLLLTGLVLVLCRGVKGDRSSIHKHLVLCLLVSEVVFVGGIHQTTAPVFCGVVAGLLHFLLTAAFVWLLLECFDLYATVSELFESEKDRCRWYAVLAYGIPAAVVAISSAIDPASYGTQSYCWINVGNYYVFSFVGPAMMCVLASLMLLLLTLCRTCCQPSAVNKTQAKLKTAKSWSRRSAVSLVLVTGCWATALSYVHDESSYLTAYFFTAANGLQGLGLFIVLCVKNEKVQKAFQKAIRRATWLPDCIKPAKSPNSEHTTGGGRPSLYVHSNGMVTLPTGALTTTGSMPSQHSWSQPTWTSCQQYQQKSNTNQTSATPGHPSTVNNLVLAEECPLQNWLPNSAYNLQQPRHDNNLSAADPTVVDPHLLDFGSLSIPPSSGHPYTDEAHLHHHNQHRQYSSRSGNGRLKDTNRRARPYPSYGTNKRRRLQEHIYETVDDDDIGSDCRLEETRAPSNASHRIHNSGPIFDPCSNWERRSLNHSGDNTKLFTSLSAVFSGSPRGKHLALLREGCFRSPSKAAYSGVPSSTDSERSSSSLMVDRSSSSPSVDSRDGPNSPNYEGNRTETTPPGTAVVVSSGQYLQSMPNLQVTPELVSFSHVLKYPSVNAVVVDSEATVGVPT